GLAGEQRPGLGPVHAGRHRRQRQQHEQGAEHGRRQDPGGQRPHARPKPYSSRIDCPTSPPTRSTNSWPSSACSAPSTVVIGYTFTASSASGKAIPSTASPPLRTSVT